MPSTQNAVFNGIQYHGQTVMGLRKFNAPYTYQDGLVNEARIVHVFKGQSSLICAGKAFSLSAGDTLLMKSDNFINRWQESDQGNTVEFAGVRLTQSFVQQLYLDSLPSRVNVNRVEQNTVGTSAIVLPDTTLLASYFASIKGYISQSDLITETLVALKIQELIELIIASDSSGTVLALLNELFVPSQPVLQQVVKTHLYTPLKVEEMAFLCHMSASTFNRKFKQVYGTSANKYLIKKRLEKAQQLLKLTDKSVTEVALECGFEELSYFSRIFKQHYQVTPSQLRKCNA
ncbi:helix-turn-helix domain-containing protein [Pseudoalteromonas luteoviolacea]|uniref:HTH araC/xylS-type domain-containing protein n=1 Tax=Pseudoalteromonas luteoviolacea S4060-1 TaxID=1365257 RepID=A0A167JKF1_9GAMM|nr:AraC family transcriptional regulator [Pseudoalteromonas luteoviolacea]KZN61243.1 hypothetical protein N478_04060 [Pseudoalteromonas luteoviolacea S4060-1]